MDDFDNSDESKRQKLEEVTDGNYISQISLIDRNLRGLQTVSTFLGQVA